MADILIRCFPNTNHTC